MNFIFFAVITLFRFKSVENIRFGHGCDGDVPTLCCGDVPITFEFFIATNTGFVF
jgi:hypothetical protein